MAPMDDLTSQLKATVDALQKRVEDLESRLHGQAQQGGAGAEGMRMILIGPPGAGTSSQSHTPTSLL